MHGTIINGCYTKYEKERDRLRIADAWTISVNTIEGEWDRIEYISEKGSYKISRNDAVCHGFFRPFQGEEKMCVPVKWWSINGNPPTGDLEPRKESKRYCKKSKPSK